MLFRREPLVRWGTAIAVALSTSPALAQSILPASDGIGTQINVQGNQIDILGGTQSGANLFHSFQQFGLNPQQVANFVADPTTQNILGRVTGGNASLINGLIQVTGSPANLYLINPSGVLFGSQASLNVPASFTATTATGLGLTGGGWFQAFGNNDFSTLSGTPNAFIFQSSQVGSIISAANLAVTKGQSLSLLGGTVISSGTLTAPDGQITIASVPGQNLLRLNQAGSLLSLDLPTEARTTALIPTPATLPQLLTGGNLSNATGVTVQNDGAIALTGSGITIATGDIVAKNLETQTATLAATQNLTLVESKLHTTGNLSLLAGNTVRVRDSIAQPFEAFSRGDLTLRGDQGIDILALNHLGQPAFVTQGALRLVSDGIISGDAHFASGNGFSVLNSRGSGGNFVSYYDPIVSALGDVTMGDYTGTSLKVEATGNITLGNVVITGADTILVGFCANNPCSPDAIRLGASPALILRAGVPSLQEPSFGYGGSLFDSFPAFLGGTTATIAPESSTSITTGNISGSVAGLWVELEAPGSITTQNITTLGGNIQLSSFLGAVNAGELNTGVSSGNAGTIFVTANDAVSLAGAQASAVRVSGDAGDGGTINLNSNNGNILVNGTLESKSSTSSGSTGQAGNIQITAFNGDVNINSLGALIDASSKSIAGGTSVGNGGNITIQARNITTSAGFDASSEVLSSSGAGNTSNAGQILLQADGDLAIAGQVRSRSVTPTGLAGNGSSITLTAGGTLTLNSSTVPDLSAIASGSINAGNPGDLFISATQTIINSSFPLDINRPSLGDVLNTPINLSNVSNAGNITILGGLGNGTGQVNINAASTLSNNVFLENVRLNQLAIDTGTTTNITFLGDSGTATQPINLLLTGNPVLQINDSVFLNNVDLSSTELNIAGSLTSNTPLVLGRVSVLGNAVITTVNQPITFTRPIESPTFSEGFPDPLTVNAGSGAITFQAAIGAVEPLAALTVNTTGQVTFGGDVTTTGGNIQVRGGTIDLGDHTFRTAGGDIQVESLGALDVSNAVLDARVARGNSGSIILSARDNLTTSTLSTSSAVAGAIKLTSEAGAIQTGDLQATGETQGGDITVNALISIVTGEIDSSATIGNGGNVVLDPINDIEVSTINTQGGASGRGGSIDITAGRFFRATGTFLDQNGQTASLSTVGGLGGGQILLRHAGGNLNTPFVIGDSSLNGTAGVITTSATNTLELNRVFPYLFVQGDIGLITAPEPPPDILPDRPVPPIAEDTVDFQDLAEEILEDVDVEALPLEAADDLVDLDILLEADQEFTQDFADYFGDSTQLNFKSEGTQQTVQRIERETGSKPAVIYLSFVPAQLPDPNQQTTKLSSSDSDLLEVIVVTPQGKPQRRVVQGATRGEVLRVAQAFRSGVTDRTSDDYLEPAQQLYQWLIAPIASTLEEQKIDNLLFLADRGLRSLPFAALHDGKQFLVERYSSGLAPSLSLTDTRYVNLKEAQLLAMGASQFQEKQPLPAVPVELSTITQKLWKGKALLNEEFTIENLRAQRRQRSFGILHLATHGEFKPGSPDQSYIQFWNQKLTLEQMRSLELNDPPLELLVLSACRTALGDEQAELGFAGLAAQSGAKSVLASLWYVSDEGTLGLMTEFYRQLAQPQITIKSSALRQAQLSFIRGQVEISQGYLRTATQKLVPLPPELTDIEQPNFAHPYYWSAFTLIGNPW